MDVELEQFIKHKISYRKAEKDAMRRGEPKSYVMTEEDWKWDEIYKRTTRVRGDLLWLYHALMKEIRRLVRVKQVRPSEIYDPNPSRYPNHNLLNYKWGTNKKA